MEETKKELTDIEVLDKVKLNKCPYCHNLMLPIGLKVNMTKEVLHKMIDLYGDVTRRTESGYVDERGIMCSNCHNDWMNEG